MTGYWMIWKWGSYDNLRYILLRNLGAEYEVAIDYPVTVSFLWNGDQQEKKNIRLGGIQKSQVYSSSLGCCEFLVLQAERFDEV